MDGLLSIVTVIGGVVTALLSGLVGVYAAKKQQRISIKHDNVQISIKNADLKKIKQLIKESVSSVVATGAKYYIDFLGNKEEIITRNINVMDVYDRHIFYKLHDEETIFGRETICQIIIDDPIVSRKHFAIRLKEDTAYVVDCSSSNGTYLNGKRLKEVAQLKVGDVISIGATSFVFNAFSDTFAKAKLEESV